VLKSFLRIRTWFIVAVIAAVIFIFVQFPDFTYGVKQFSSKILLAPARGYTAIKQYFRSKSELLSENESMREEVTKLTLEMEKLKDLRLENERLRALLDFKGKFGFNTVSAEILARNPNDWFDSIFISKGQKSGIKKNSAVCSAKGLLGKVVEVEPETSSVMLITHPNFKTGGAVKETRINGIVVGSGNGFIRLMYIPLDMEVKEGSSVVTSGYSRIFPEGIGIGKIVSVRKSRTGLYKYAVVKPFANPFDQDEVLCIK
jgi:rod shape-determining protein MreC